MYCQTRCVWLYIYKEYGKDCESWYHLHFNMHSSAPEWLDIFQVMNVQMRLKYWKDISFRLCSPILLCLFLFVDQLLDSLMYLIILFLSPIPLHLDRALKNNLSCSEYGGSNSTSSHFSLWECAKNVASAVNENIVLKVRVKARITSSAERQGTL